MNHSSDPGMNPADRPYQNVTRRTFIKRTTGTVLCFGLAATATSFAAKPKTTKTPCSGGGECSVTTNTTCFDNGNPTREIKDCTKTTGPANCSMMGGYVVQGGVCNK